MSRVPILQAPIGGLRAPRVRNQTEPGAGVLAEFGQQLQEVGLRIEGERLARDRARAQVSITEALNRVALDFQRETDPDIIDRSLESRLAAARSEILEAHDPQNADEIGTGFDELAARHAYSLGQRAIQLREGSARDTLTHLQVASLRSMAVADRETAGTLRETYAGQVDRMVGLGYMTPQEAALAKQQFAGDADLVAAQRQLLEDPAALLDGLSGGEYRDLEPSRRATLQGQAQGAVTAAEKERAAEDARASRERAAMIGADLSDIASIARKGGISDREHLLSDPSYRVHPDYREAAAMVALRNEGEALHTLTAADLERKVAEAEVAVVAKPYDLERRDLLRNLLETRQDAAETDSATRAAEAARILDDIAHLAGEGRISAFEGFLSAPYFQNQPGYEKARAAIETRNALPQFRSLPADEMERLIGIEQQRVLSAPFENDRVTAMRAVLADVKAGWENDPIAFAAQAGYRPADPLPNDLSEGDEAWARAFGRRRAYAHSLRGQGHMAAGVQFLSNAERTDLARAAQPDAEPADRVRLARLIADGFQEDAGRVLREIDADPVFSHMAGMMAQGGSPVSAERAFLGQQALAAKTVALPKPQVRDLAVRETLGAVLADDPSIEGQLRQVADALYAANARNLDPDDDGAHEKAYSVALQQAAGQVQGRRTATGGISEINGAKVMLPIGVTAEQVEDALARASNAFLRATPPGMLGALRQTPYEPDFEPLRAWEAANARPNGGRPVFGGREMTGDDLDRAELRAVGQDLYALRIARNGGFFDVTDSATGGLFVFRLRDLMNEAGR